MSPKRPWSVAVPRSPNSRRARPPCPSLFRRCKLNWAEFSPVPIALGATSVGPKRPTARLSRFGLCGVQRYGELARHLGAGQSQLTLTRTVSSARCSHGACGRWSRTPEPLVDSCDNPAEEPLWGRAGVDYGLTNHFRIMPKVLYQKPLIGPNPNIRDYFSPETGIFYAGLGARNVLDDPFVVRKIER